MKLFNASSLFNDDGVQALMGVAHDPEKLQQKIIEAKKLLLEMYHFSAYNVPDDFADRSYIIASNHLTDSDAPLIMSYYHQLMQPVLNECPHLFIFAKENCFNGVSIPRELQPLLAMEHVFEVDRNSIGGSMAAMKAADKWFRQGRQPKHFLIFAQGTIYDINQDTPQDIEPGAFWLAKLLQIPVLPAFIEYAVEGQPNRLVFGEPIAVEKDCRQYDGYKALWLERVIAAQHDLARLTGVPAREAQLDEAHRTRKRFKTST